MLPLSILLLGGGGREHALAWKLAQSPLCARLFALPGNPGIAAHAHCIDGDPTDRDAVAALALDLGIDLVVVGPEAPLAAGVADACSAAGIAVFGPSAAAARLEASKAFTKEICAEAGIPTARWARFDRLSPALSHIDRHPGPIVVKADGLAAGKGVTVAATSDEARAAVELLFADGPADVVIEEYLEGEEISFFVLCDGQTAVPLLAAQDHKRVGDGDTGPNTGGMGAYAPASLFTADHRREVMEHIIAPTLAAMAGRGTPFRGVLFAGLMLTAAGPKLIEYNVRFGDPECEVLMPLLRSDLVALLHGAATGRLGSVAPPEWEDGTALTVVIAARGYPGLPRRGGVIRGLDAAVDDPWTQIFHAGTTRRDDGTLAASGGRVLAVTARGGDVADAAARAYRACRAVDYPDGFWRSDIGWREIARIRRR
jgi:phosphoribosylamine--glycine ligase